MNWPHTVTLFNYTKQGYNRAVLRGVLWEDTKGKNVNKTGSSAVDSAKVFIPFSVNTGGKLYKLPTDYQLSPAGAWTLQTKAKDFVVKGECPFDPAGHQISELLSSYEVLTIMDVQTCDYGSTELQHWEVGAK